MHELIPISWLNDFLFCPYSIYLHQIYHGQTQENYHELPQTQGKQAHQTIDRQRYSTRANDLVGIEVHSESLGIYGKIDIYHGRLQKLVERKRQIKHIFDGYKLQLYAQYFCMIEMNYPVSKLAFYSMVDNKSYPIDVPDEAQTKWFMSYLSDLKQYHPLDDIEINPKKCSRCIYRHLCEKIPIDYV